MRTLRVSLVAAVVAAAALAAAGASTIRLSPFPNAEVADGHSQIVVNAQVSTDDGRPVPDGTQVVFETTLGSFRESVVRTAGGRASAILIAGGVPGVAHVKASVAAGDAIGSTCEVEFAKSREELSQTRETIEATSTGSLVYANDSRIVEGVAPDKGVTVRYRDLEIHANVVQLDLQSYTLKAFKATVRRGRRTTQYDSLSLDLSSRTGYGLTNYPLARPDSLVAYPGGVAFVESGDESTPPVVAPPRMHYGIVKVERDREAPLDAPLDSDPFAKADISESPSTIGAKMLVVYARREIQFHKADIYVNNAKIIRFPLYVVDLQNTSSSPLVTDDLLSFNDNQIALNYHHYLTLRPGLTSQIHFHTGDRYGQSLTANRAASLDYELGWSKGDDMKGGFTLSGMGRTDWIASVNQNWRIDDRSSANFQMFSPGGRSVGGSGNVGRSFGSYGLSLNGQQSQVLNGPSLNRSSSQYYGLNFDRNPVRVPGTHVRTSYGLTASQSSSTGFEKLEGGSVRQISDGQSGVGFTARAFTDSLPLDKATSANASFAATQLYGDNAGPNNGLGLNGTLSLTRRLSSNANAFVTYNYLNNQSLIGQHSLSLIGNYSRGATGLRLSANKSLDVERMSFTGELSYRLTSLWRMSYSHFFNSFPVVGANGDAVGSTSYTEFYATLAYRIGWREVGLTWSSRTHRPGLQLMNVDF